MQAGQYEAKIVDYGAGETSKGTPRIFVKFEVVDGNPLGGEKIFWHGYLSAGAINNTLKALLVMGCTSPDLEPLKNGPESGLLDMDTPVSITVEEEEYQGKITPKVKWVNALGGSKFRKDVTPQVASALSGAAGAMAALMAKQGVKATVNKEEGPGF